MKKIKIKILVVLFSKKKAPFFVILILPQREYDAAIT